MIERWWVGDRALSPTLMDDLEAARRLDLEVPGSASTRAKSCAPWSSEFGRSACTKGLVSQSAYVNLGLGLRLVRVDSVRSHQPRQGRPMHDRNYRDSRHPVISHLRGLTSGWTIERFWLGLIVTLYVASLPVTAYRLPRPDSSPTPGWICLIFIPLVMFYPAWWANPILLAGCLFLRRGNRWGVLLCGLVAVVLAATFPIQEVLWNVPSQYLRTDAQWRHYFGMTMAGLRVGYWLWLMSMVALFTAAGVMSGPQGKKSDRMSQFDDL
jgi:hypothetical protein